MLRLGPWFNSPFLQRQPGIGNHQIEIQSNGIAEALTGRTGAVRIVETEEPGLRCGIDSPVIFALEVFGERVVLAPGLTTIPVLLENRFPASRPIAGVCPAAPISDPQAHRHYRNRRACSRQVSASRLFVPQSKDG